MSTMVLDGGMPRSRSKDPVTSLEAGRAADLKGSQAAVLEQQAQSRDSWQLLPHVVLQHLLAPNVVISNLQGTLTTPIPYVMTWRFVPDAVDRTTIEHTLLTYGPVADADRAHFDARFEAARAVTSNEDFPESERVHANLATGTLDAAVEATLVDDDAHAAGHGLDDGDAGDGDEGRAAAADDAARIDGAVLVDAVLVEEAAPLEGDAAAVTVSLVDDDGAARDDDEGDAVAGAPEDDTLEGETVEDAVIVEDPEIDEAPAAEADAEAGPVSRREGGSRELAHLPHQRPLAVVRPAVWSGCLKSRHRRPRSRP